MADPAPAVAITGMAAVFPGSSNLDEYWRNLVDGFDAITEISPDRIDQVYFGSDEPGIDRFGCRRGGFVDTQAVLDPVALGVVPNAVDSSEPDQLLSLALAARALADAGGERLGEHRERAGVIVGRGGYLTPGLARLDQRVRTSEQLVAALHSLLPGLAQGELARVKQAFVERLGPDRADAAIDLVPNLAASRVANRLDLGGPAYTVDAACASSLLAVDQAVHELRSGRCDLVVAGGVHLCHDVTLWSVFTQLGALSRSGTIRPFDRRADGLLIGEGGGMVVLQRLADAEREGARIYAVVRGTGVASDGRSASLMRPSVSGQVRSLRQAWEASGVDPAHLGLIEAHGTATPTGDAAEAETLQQFFGGSLPGRKVGLGSVKSMIGHTMPAAGIAGLIKAALAVHHGVLPPTLHCEEPLPALEGSAFEPVTEARPWDGHGLRVAAVNAFGFGGINGHVVIEQHRDGAAGHHDPVIGGAGGGAGTTPGVSGTGAGATPGVGAALGAGVTSAGPAAGGAGPGLDRVLLLAGSQEELQAQLDDYQRQLARGEHSAGGVDGPPLPDRAPAGGPGRLALFSPTAERVGLARKVIARGNPWHGRSDLWFTPDGLVAGGGRIAFVFPGVEPSFVPRVDDVARHFGWALPVLASSDAVAEDLEGLGRSLIAVGRLLHAAVSELGLEADLMAGQSIGEWSGMIASTMIPPPEVDGFIETLRPGSLVVPGVAFAALGCAVGTAEALLGPDRGARHSLAISHDNCPHQTIVCGNDTDVAALMERARSAKVLGQVLPFRSGFHTPMFEPFLEPFRRALARLPLQDPDVPLWSATTCSPYPAEPEAVRALAVAHLVQRVRFRELSLALHDAGARLFVQVGVGSLPGLLEDSLSGRDMMAVATNQPRRSGLDQLLRVMASCWVEGVEGLRFDRLVARPGVGAGAGLVPGAGPGVPGPPPGRGLPSPSASSSTSPSRVPSPASSSTSASRPGQPASARGRLRTLPLSSPLVRLEPMDLGVVRGLGDGFTGGPARGQSDRSLRIPGPPAAPVPALPQSVRADHAVRALGGAVGAELQALLDEVAEASGQVVRALAEAPPAAAAAAAAAPPAPPVAQGMAAPPANPSTTAPPAPARRETPLATSVTVRRLSIEDVPALRDHCFYRQPPGWPSMADQFPVVPMTALFEMMGEAAAALFPGSVVVAIEDVRALRWLAVAPPVEVTVRATELVPPPGLPAEPGPPGTHRARVVIDGYARATVVVAADYPARDDRTPRRPSDRLEPLADAEPSPVSAARMYEDRFMFHGPAYQGVQHIAAMGPTGVDGTLRAIPAPGALLDNAGQLMGLWMMLRHETDRLALPSSIDRIAFRGPPPPAGTEVETAVRITGVDELMVRADMALEVGGRPWVRIDGWVDRRFESDEVVWPLLTWPERSTLVGDHGGWVLASERWRTSASRELMMRRYLGEDERQQYAAHNPRAQRLFLLGRIAAKDAARRWLWDHGAGPLWPVEVEVRNEPGGRPALRVPGGADLRVSIAHTQWVGVAAVAEGADVGIDVERVEPRPERFGPAAFAPAELDLLAAAPAPSGSPAGRSAPAAAGRPAVSDEWLTRGWAAKEALSKARGTGLEARPKQFTIEARQDETLVVDGCRVATVRLGDLVVARTMVADVQGAPRPEGGADGE